MICTTQEPLCQAESLQRKMHKSHGSPPHQIRSSQRPLLDWIAIELQKEDGLGSHQAAGQARRILEQAFAAVTNHC